MWKLTLSEGDNGPWLRSTNNHVGKQYWEFDPSLGTPQERARVEKVRNKFTQNRFLVKHSSDLLMKLQFARENRTVGIIDKPTLVKLEREEEIAEQVATTPLRRALRFYSTLQAEDGFRPGDYGGPLHNSKRWLG